MHMIFIFADPEWRTSQDVCKRPEASTNSVRKSFAIWIEMAIWPSVEVGGGRTKDKYKNIAGVAVCC
jgi:hypothetical protein